MKQPGLIARFKAALSPVGSSVSSWMGSSFGVIKEPFTNAWQRNLEASACPGILGTSSVYSCVNIISSDLSKLPMQVMRKADNGTYSEMVNSPYTLLLRKPNFYQTPMQFLQQWVASKLTNGNTYIWKMRDARGVVNEMYVLDPTKVQVLVAEDGSVFYSIGENQLAANKTQIVIPARDIIHDRAITLSHPLVGVSPLYAAGVSAMMGARILTNSENFFANMSRPSGTLNAPGAINNDVAISMRDAFEKNYTGGSIGRVAVLQQGLTYQPLSVDAMDSQLIEQLKWTIVDVARVYRVPLFLLNDMSGTQYKNTEAMSLSYYQGCLQYHIEAIEQLLNIAFDLPSDQSIEFNLDGLFRMDTESRYNAYKSALSAGWISPNEVRRKEGMGPVEGGEEPRMQMQYVPLSTDPAPAGVPAPIEEPTTEETDEPTTESIEDETRAFDGNAAIIIAKSFFKRQAERAVNANG